MPNKFRIYHVTLLWILVTYLAVQFQFDIPQYNNLEIFESDFNDDIEYLVKHGIDRMEIPLLFDYLNIEKNE